MGVEVCLCQNPTRSVVKDLRVESGIIDNFSYKEIQYSSESDRALNMSTPSQKNPSEKKQTKKLEIEEIIPENKLHTKNNNEILFLSELTKFSQNSDEHVFCTLTRVYFSMYENKQAFISMKKPSVKIRLSQITKIDIDKADNLMYFAIYQVNNDIIKFKTKTTELLFKWVVVLNFFVHKGKKKTYN